MPAKLSQRRILASFLWYLGEEAVYAYGDEDDPQYLMLPAGDWEDMGKPANITVTIQPGDLLNEAE